MYEVIPDSPLHLRSVAQLAKQPALNRQVQRSIPCGSTNLSYHLGVAQSGQEFLPWKQEVAGSPFGPSPRAGRPRAFARAKAVL